MFWLNDRAVSHIHLVSPRLRIEDHDGFRPAIPPVAIAVDLKVIFGGASVHDLLLSVTLTIV
jgi:hypothetical protein